ncbi:hypothetical protein VPH35_082794 [Triticum aestivum]
MGGPSWVYCHSSRRCLPRGKVMGTRYPDQVGGHKPCVPELDFELMSPFGTVLPRQWPLVPLVGTGPPWTEPIRGVGRSGRESVMAVGRFCRNAVGPPKSECEAMGSVVWVQCATSEECILIYR